MEALKAFLKKNFPDGIQMFNTPNLAGDYMEEIYEDGEIYVLFAPSYGYIEVFGLTNEQFEELENECFWDTKSGKTIANIFKKY